ncbi:MAG: DUF58 domain-containing protein [Acidimicrobiia bacterium]|nr:DUF58 domain-containing protein [Acidimicrobiia bacterium]
MPNTRGWGAVGAAVALAILWIFFGERELLAAAVLLMTGLVVGVLLVRMASPQVQVSRRVAPEQVHEGDRAIVEIELAAPSTLRNIIVEDTVHGLGSARFAAGKVGAGAPLRARYEVLCRPRGVYAIGPAVVSSGDPLGLAEAGGNAGGEDRLVVFPAVEELIGAPAVRGQDPSVQASRPTQAPHGGEDFFTLREYQIGDDLRRVHWPSSAKRDEIMIRQLEVPWQSRALILLDRRRGVYAGEVFEHAVKGAASMLRHLHRGGFSPELWTGEHDGRSMTHSRYSAAMGTLATVQAGKFDLAAGVARLRSSSIGGGALIVVTGEPDDSVSAAYRHLARAFARSFVFAVAPEGSGLLTLLRRAGVTAIAAPSDEDWATAWKEATESTWSTASVG